MAKKKKTGTRKKQETLLERRANQFAKEVAEAAERFGVSIDKKVEKEEDWGFRVFGFFGPLLGSIIGIFILSFFVWTVSLLDFSAMGFVSSVGGFISRNIYWFFGLMLFFGYSDYISKRFKRRYWVVSPIVNGIGFLFIIWIAIWTLNTINSYASSVFVSFLSNILYSNMPLMLIAFIVLDYVLLLVERLIIMEWKK